MPSGRDIRSAEVQPRVVVATEENFRISPFKPEQVHIKAGGGNARLPMGFQVHRPGRYAVTLDITLATSDGQKIRLQTAEPVEFDCTPRTGGVTIEIDGVANLRGVALPQASTVRVGERGNFRLDAGDGSMPSASAKAPAARIALTEREYLGIARELDLRAFFEDWCKDGRKRADLRYVDPQTNEPLRYVDPKTNEPLQTARVKEACCIKVTTHQAGYLTLFGLGTSKAYYVYAPNRVAPDATNLTHRARDKHAPRLDSQLPGNLLPLPLEGAPENETELHLADPGVEQIMAVVTANPQFDLADPPKFMEELRAEDVIRLLRAIQRDRDAELGFVEIVVERAE